VGHFEDVVVIKGEIRQFVDGKPGDTFSIGGCCELKIV
jgi:hypothetical protein